VHVPNLQVLNVSDNWITSESASNLGACLQFVPSLKILEIVGPGESIGMECKGLEALAKGLVHVRNLQTLKISWHLIGDEV
jgi:Ran GTPase-activating protein (RanGAP) involved in mRNA processing and transport